MMMSVDTSKHKKLIKTRWSIIIMLFNILADTLAIIIKRIKHDGQIEGAVPRLVDGGLPILQYTNDTISIWFLLP
jgi:hypothetical protein